MAFKWDKNGTNRDKNEAIRMEADDHLLLGRMPMIRQDVNDY